MVRTKKKVPLILIILFFISFSKIYGYSNSVNLLDWYNRVSHELVGAILQNTTNLLLENPNFLDTGLEKISQEDEDQINSYTTEIKNSTQATILEHNKGYLKQLTETKQKLMTENLSVYTDRKKKELDSHLTQDATTVLEEILNP